MLTIAVQAIDFIEINDRWYGVQRRADCHMRLPASIVFGGGHMFAVICLQERASRIQGAINA
jgi:hypothetical protein